MKLDHTNKLTHSSKRKTSIMNLDDAEKARRIQAIQRHFTAILEVLGLDLNHDSLKETPRRIAEMYVNELFIGLQEQNKPKMSLFANEAGYGQMLVEKNIHFHSTCEHHFLPVIGRAHVAYIPAKKVLGLSKINRLVRYHAARPQMQERMTVQILNDMRSALQVEDVAVWVEAAHLCVTARGIKDQLSSTITMKYSGEFLQTERRNEFLGYIHKAGDQS